MKKQNILFFILLFLAFASCEKAPFEETNTDTIVPEVITPSDSDTTSQGNETQFFATHSLILNEGNQGGNNSTLSFLDLTHGSLTNNWFFINNNQPLGSLAQDVVVYGSKAYVTVSEDGILWAIDTLTGQAHSLSLSNRYPRYIAPADGKLFVSCYNPHSVIRIDTATLSIESECTLGDFNPEGIAALKGKIFVASTHVADNLGTESYDDKVYVLDPSSLSILSILTVGTNPQSIIPIDEDHLVVNCWGSWDLSNGTTSGEGSAIIDASSLSVTQTEHLLSRMAVYNGKIYAYSSIYDASWNQISSYFILDPSTFSITPLSSISLDNGNPYSIAVHPQSGNIYIASDGNYTSNGDIYCFSPTGQRQWKKSVGMLPSKIIFY